MGSLLRVLNRQSYYFYNLTKPHNFINNNIRFSKNIGSCVSYRTILIKSIYVENNSKILSCSLRQCSSQPIKDGNPSTEEPKKVGLVQKFKQMYKEYWYVLLPVHMITSAVWFGSFYYCVRSGVDVIGALEYVGVSEKLLTPIKESSAGYFALAFALYKLVTPLRYTVTIGGTTYAINKLTAIGWIKPLPSRETLKKIIQEKKGNIQDKITESKKFTHIKDEWKKFKKTDNETQTKE